MRTLTAKISCALVCGFVLADSANAIPSADNLIREMMTAYTGLESYLHEGHAAIPVRSKGPEGYCAIKKTFTLHFIRDKGYRIDWTEDGGLFEEGSCNSGYKEELVLWSNTQCLRAFFKRTMPWDIQSVYFGCVSSKDYQFSNRDSYPHSEQIVFERLIGLPDAEDGDQTTRWVEEGTLPGGENVWILGQKKPQIGTEKFYIDRSRYFIRRYELYPLRNPERGPQTVDYDVVKLNPALTEDSITYTPPVGAVLYSVLILQPLAALTDSSKSSNLGVFFLVVAVVLFAIGYWLVRWAPDRFRRARVVFIVFWLAFPLLSLFVFEAIIFLILFVPGLVPIPPALVWSVLGIVLARSLRGPEEVRRRLTIAGGLAFVAYLLVFLLLISGKTIT